MIAIGNDRIIVFPIYAKIVAIIRPNTDLGDLSPYPTVVSVVITSQTASYPDLLFLQKNELIFYIIIDCNNYYVIFVVSSSSTEFDISQ